MKPGHWVIGCGLVCLVLMIADPSWTLWCGIVWGFNFGAWFGRWATIREQQRRAIE